MKKKITFKNKKKSQKIFKFISQENKINNNNLNKKIYIFNNKKINKFNFFSIKNNFFSFDIQKEFIVRKKV